jgi:hypothetical protein
MIPGKLIIRFLSLIVLTVATCNLSAQFGIKAGLSVSNFYYTETGPVPDLSYEVDLRPYLSYDIESVQLGEQKALPGFYISAYYEFNLTRWFSLQPEISFVQKGTNFSQSNYENLTYKVRMNYLEFPLLVGFKYVNKEKIVSKFYLGGHASFRLHAVKVVETHNSDKTKTTLSNTNTAVFGLNIGNTLKFHIKKGFLILDLRAVIDLSDAFNIPEDQIRIYHQIQNIKTTGFYISVGHEF